MDFELCEHEFHTNRSLIRQFNRAYEVMSNTLKKLPSCCLCKSGFLSFVVTLCLFCICISGVYLKVTSY